MRGRKPFSEPDAITANGVIRSASEEQSSWMMAQQPMSSLRSRARGAGSPMMGCCNQSHVDSQSLT